MKNGFPQTMNHGFYWSNQTIKTYELWIWLAMIRIWQKVCIHLTCFTLYFWARILLQSPTRHSLIQPFPRSSWTLWGPCQSGSMIFHLASFLWELLWIRGSRCQTQWSLCQTQFGVCFLFIFSLALFSNATKLYQLLTFKDLFIHHLYFRVGRSCLTLIT